MAKSNFNFRISLTILNHLGRKQDRNFITILGEAISNSWDADAENIWIYIDKNTNSFYIKDDGVGMDSSDFEGKFLNIGYSKREDLKSTKSPIRERPYIGGKGIGKLALLSCADKISIISKTKNDTNYTGGTIDNSELDKAIIDNLDSESYNLEDPQMKIFEEYTENHNQGTIIYFENIKKGIRNHLDYLMKTIALYFRFTLLDESFKIHINDKLITLDELDFLAEKTQLLWVINNFNDEYTESKLQHLEKPATYINSNEVDIKGFIASVKMPKDLTIYGAEERTGIDLFTNGRLREKNIIKHIPTARIAESYYYGQIHFDNLDSGEDIDRFTTSREGIIDSDPLYEDFLLKFRKIILDINTDWDKFRVDLREDGDPENLQISKKTRKAKELTNISINEHSISKTSDNFEKVEEWSKNLHEDAAFNTESYSDCFVSENLLRKYIDFKIENLDRIIAKGDWKKKLKDFKDKEEDFKNQANLSIAIRQNISDLNYFGMHDLATLVSENYSKENKLLTDAAEYAPIRNALAHTARLTEDAKKKLTTVYNNIKAKLKIFLED